MNYLVTGGAGFIGSHLVDLLLSLGHRVTIIDDLSTGKFDNIHKSANFIHIDINHLNRQIDFRFYDAIFHLAAKPRIQPSFLEPEVTASININGTYHLLELCRLYNPQIKFIYAGSSSFYSSPYIAPYSFTKYVGEECCKMYNQVYGISTAIARFFNVYGERHIRQGDYSTVIGIFEHQKINRLPLTIAGDGSKRRDFTHVHDVASALYAMSHKRFNQQIFDIGSGVNYSISEIADAFLPDNIIYLPNKNGEAQSTLADISLTKSNLQWSPKYNVIDYINQFIRSL